MARHDLGPVAFDLIESMGAGTQGMLDRSLKALEGSCYGGQKHVRAALRMLG